MGHWISLIVIALAIPVAILAYIVGSERLLRVFPENLVGRVRPWLWVAPAATFLGVFLVYPTISTLLESLRSTSGDYAGTENYGAIFTDPESRQALKNNLIWLVVLPALTVGLGLLIAVLADKVRYERAAKTLVFMPLAISAVAAAVIWRFMYDYRPPGATQTGTLNALLTAAGRNNPVAWVIDWPLNTVALIVVMVWMWTGFAMVVLSASLKGIETEIIESARVDGATEIQVFRRIIFPLLRPTLAVVSTTMVIIALKAFDIVYVMTNGNFQTDVIANRMYNQLFVAGDSNRAAAIAIVLLIAILPVMILNARRFRAERTVR